MKPLVAVLVRDVVLAWRSGGAGLALAFFVLVIVLLPLGVGTDPALLLRIGPGLIWIAVLLAVLLSIERLFQADLEAAVLDLMIASRAPFEVLVIAKLTAHWLTVGLPLTALSFVAAFLLGLPLQGSLVLALSLLIGTPGLSAIGSVASAITAGVRRGGLLLTLLVLPLYAPFVIFGAGAAGLAVNPAPPLSPEPSLYLLGAASLVALIGALLFITSAVRSQLS